MTFIAGEAPAQSFECTAKVRYRQPDQRCHVEMQGDECDGYALKIRSAP